MKIQNISKTFDGKAVLENVSFTVEKGSPVCLFGASGCGKTTMLNIIAGLVEPDSGSIEGNRGRISYIFQEDRLLEWLTAEENIMLTVHNREAAEKFIKVAGLSESLNLYPSQMSGGMRKRTAIARAVAHDGEIFLMDEPFNGTDKRLVEEMTGFLREYIQDKIFILVSHNENEAELIGAELLKFA